MDFKERYKFNPKTDLIGKGGFSKVYRATDTMLEREVALKFFTAQTEDKYNLLSEIRRVIHLQHPNIVQYYDLAAVPSPTFHGDTEIVNVGILEYVNSGNIYNFIKSRHSEQDMLDVVLGILRGLQYIHLQKIIHRDIKPQNILMQKDKGKWIPKIADFGISKQIGGNSGVSSQLLGSVEYMAPEQFNAAKFGVEGKLHTNVDLWSFGVILNEVFSGILYFGKRNSGVSTQEIMQNILVKDIPEKFQNIKEPYQTILQMCLVKDANLRVKDAGELISIIERHVQTGTLSEKKLEPEKPAPVPTPVASVESKIAKPQFKFPKPALKTFIWAVPLALLLLAGIIFSIPGIFSSGSGKDASQPQVKAPVSNVANVHKPDTATIGKLRSLCDAYWNEFDYEGAIVNGKPQGEGKAIYRNGNGYKGNFLDGKMHGQGTFTWVADDIFSTQKKSNKKNGTINIPSADSSKYVGEFKDGLAEGKGLYSVANGRYVKNCKDCVKYEGDWSAGMKDGFGKCFNAAGKLIHDGHFIDDKPEGDYPFVPKTDASAKSESVSGKKLLSGTVYSGSTVNGKREGKGKLTFADGSSYEGDFKADSITGQGTYIYSDKSDCRGNFINGKRDGQVLCVFADRSKYDGEWKNDKITGTGKYTYPNGDVCFGSFADGKREGSCSCNFAVGGSYKGNWIKDKISGSGVYSYPNRDVCSGNFSDGKREGICNCIFKDDKIKDYDGDWQNDQKNGKGKAEYRDGGKYDGAWANDMREGEGTYTPAKGKEQKGMWSKDVYKGKK